MSSRLLRGFLPNECVFLVLITLYCECDLCDKISQWWRRNVRTAAHHYYFKCEPCPLLGSGSSHFTSFSITLYEMKVSWLGNADVVQLRGQNSHFCQMLNPLP